MKKHRRPKMLLPLPLCLCFFVCVVMAVYDSYRIHDVALCWKLTMILALPTMLGEIFYSSELFSGKYLFWKYILNTIPCFLLMVVTTAVTRDTPSYPAYIGYTVFSGATLFARCIVCHVYLEDERLVQREWPKPQIYTVHVDDVEYRYRVDVYDEL